jgi:P-type E1-E2 ATPase
MSSHHVGQAIVREAASRNGGLPPAADFREEPGLGVEARVGERHVVVGARRWAAADHGPAAGAEGTSAAHVSVDHRYAGRIELADRVRAEVRGLLDELATLGVRRTVMLTGDSDAAAARVARETGIAEVHANLLPGDKVGIVGELRRRGGGVLMVGDGINDAPALAAATVGIAMGAHAPAAAAQAADIVLLVDDVRRVGEAVAIGRRTRRIALQSMGVGLAVSLALMIIAALGHIPPALGAVFQETLDIAVIANALRARQA